MCLYMYIYIMCMYNINDCTTLNLYVSRQFVHLKFLLHPHSLLRISKGVEKMFAVAKQNVT